MSGDPNAAPGRRNADLGPRLASTAVLLPLALFCAWYGSWPAFGLAALAAAVVFAEWAHVIGRSEALVPRRFEVVLGLVSVALATLIAGPAGLAAALGVVAAGAIGVALLSRSAWLVAGVVYAAALGIPIAAIRADAALGLEAILVLLVLVWATDSVAFFAGRGLGGPKLWPRISPKKTWSGSIGGLLGGVAAAFGTALLLGIPGSPGLAVLLLFLSLASQAGDLFESAVKRHFHRKDASGIIPGHGGLMDRVDGLVFAGALALAIGCIHGGPDAIAAGVLIW